MRIRKAIAAVLVFAIAGAFAGCHKQEKEVITGVLSNYISEVEKFDADGVLALTNLKEGDSAYDEVSQLLDRDYYPDAELGVIEVIASTITLMYSDDKIEVKGNEATVSVAYMIADWKRAIDEGTGPEDIIAKIRDSRGNFSVSGKIKLELIDGKWKITDLTNLDEVFEFCNDSTVSMISAKCAFMVEEYFGLTESEIRAILENSGISYSIEYEVRNDIDPGIVIHQNFKAGTELLKTDSVLFIVTVSAESEDWSLGDYSMMDHQSVYDILTGFGFTVVEIAEQSDTIVPGCVIRTEPAAGSVIERGSTITVYYAE